MGFFRWLYRLPGRISRDMETTALAASVVHGEGIGGTQVDTQSMNAALSKMEGSERREGDSADEYDR